MRTTPLSILLATAAIMTAAIPATAARAEMGARAMGAVSISMGWGAPLGLIYVGLLADNVGAPRAVEINAVVAAVILFAVMVFIPALRKFSD